MNNFCFTIAMYQIVFVNQGTISEKFNDLLIQLSDTELTKLAHHPKDMIKSCRYTGSGLSHEEACDNLKSGNTVKVFSPTAGNLIEC